MADALRLIIEFAPSVVVLFLLWNWGRIEGREKGAIGISRDADFHHEAHEEHEGGEGSES
jgi:hypothetical protein